MPRRRTLWKGAAAGLVGGMVASWAMNRFQELWTALAEGAGAAQRHGEQGGQVKKGALQRGHEDGESATAEAGEEISESLLGVGLDRREKKAVGAALHFLFGASLGMVYGALAEYARGASAGAGLPFGAAVWLGADEIGMPAAGLSKPPSAYPAEVHLQSLASHLVYGGVTELTRRVLRGRPGDVAR